ncbi:unnamed protein product [Polarella glacialis]|uniref:Uncharacterized protein n=1 Tax=Polarella glacialis TaxID=89957 RepID=A0A813DM85_POLGL|nr:unnamed protein product [Polarella glacialis]
MEEQACGLLKWWQLLVAAQKLAASPGRVQEDEALPTSSLESLLHQGSEFLPTEGWEPLHGQGIIRLLVQCARDAGLGSSVRAAACKLISDAISELAKGWDAEDDSDEDDDKLASEAVQWSTDEELELLFELVLDIVLGGLKAGPDLELTLADVMGAGVDLLDSFLLSLPAARVTETMTNLALRRWPSLLECALQHSTFQCDLMDKECPSETERWVSCIFEFLQLPLPGHEGPSIHLMGIFVRAQIVGLSPVIASAKHCLCQECLPEQQVCLEITRNQKLVSWFTSLAQEPVTISFFKTFCHELLQLGEIAVSELCTSLVLLQGFGKTAVPVNFNHFCEPLASATLCLTGQHQWQAAECAANALYLLSTHYQSEQVFKDVASALQILLAADGPQSLACVMMAIFLNNKSPSARAWLPKSENLAARLCTPELSPALRPVALNLLVLLAQDGPCGTRPRLLADEQPPNCTLAKRAAQLFPKGEGWQGEPPGTLGLGRREFQTNDSILVHGLQGRKDLNGKSGRVCSYQSAKDRHGIVFCGETVLVKAANLCLSPTVPVKRSGKKDTGSKNEPGDGERLADRRGAWNGNATASRSSSPLAEMSALQRWLHGLDEQLLTTTTTITSLRNASDELDVPTAASQQSKEGSHELDSIIAVLARSPNLEVVQEIFDSSLLLSSSGDPSQMTPSQRKEKRIQLQVC